MLSKIIMILTSVIYYNNSANDNIYFDDCVHVGFRILPLYKDKLELTEKKRIPAPKVERAIQLRNEDAKAIDIFINDAVLGVATHKNYVINLSEFLCSCPDATKGYICKHIRATAMILR